MNPELDWAPPEQRLQGALWRGMSHLRKREYVAAYRGFVRATAVAEGEDREFVRGLIHAAAAGYKHRDGNVRGAERQRAHARRRLEPFRPRHREIEIEEILGAL